jgi:tungstate transport system substrate-binding protein
MKRIKRLSVWALVFLLLLVPGLALAKETGFVLLSSTIGPVDAGIVGALEDRFEKETGIRVRHVGAGTGAALDMARKGPFDLVLVHAKALEEKFIEEGFGTERIPLMYNDFVIVGPVADPAGIKGIKTAAEALKIIAEKQALFISRGDKSGTHVAEMDLWDKADTKPAGDWYSIYDKGSLGNAPTLKYANEKNAYTVIDRATYLSLKKEIQLIVCVEGDEAMINFISLIPVNPKKFPGVHYKETMTFVKWLTSPQKGQKIIESFGKETYGEPLFFPNSTEWHKTRKVPAK